jgi:hypothetical protein
VRRGAQLSSPKIKPRPGQAPQASNRVLNHAKLALPPPKTKRARLDRLDRNAPRRSRPVARSRTTAPLNSRSLPTDNKLRQANKLVRISLGNLRLIQVSPGRGLLRRQLKMPKAKPLRAKPKPSRPISSKPRLLKAGAKVECAQVIEPRGISSLPKPGPPHRHRLTILKVRPAR